MLGMLDRLFANPVTYTVLPVFNICVFIKVIINYIPVHG